MDFPLPEILSNMAGVAVVMYFMQRQQSYLEAELRIARDEARDYRNLYESLLVKLSDIPVDGEAKAVQGA
jgi:hypothetical protein